MQAQSTPEWSAIGTLLAMGTSLVAIAIAWGRRGAAAEAAEKQQAKFEGAMDKALDQQRTEFRESIEDIRKEHATFAANTGTMIASMSNSLNLLSAALTGFGGSGTGALAKLDKLSRRVHKLQSLVTALLLHSGVKVPDDDVDNDET